MDITAQEHAHQMVLIAQGALDRIRVMRLTKGERDVLTQADKLLTTLRDSLKASR